MTDTRFIKTDNEITDSIVNVCKLLDNNRNKLELNEIYNYDEMMIPRTPAISVVFDNALPVSKGLGNRCNLMNTNLIIYLYLEKLSLGRETLSHIERLGRLVKILYSQSSLYGLCHSEPMTITNATMAGRRLESNLFLVGQVNITVPVRFCWEANP